MKDHTTNLANVVIGNDVVLPRLGALARADFERQNGIGDLLDYAGAAGVVTNTVKINAHVFADVCLENIAQLPIHPLRTNCVHPARLANRHLFFVFTFGSSIAGSPAIHHACVRPLTRIGGGPLALRLLGFSPSTLNYLSCRLVTS